MTQSSKPKKTGTVLWSVLTALCAVLLIASMIGSYVAFGAAQAINIALQADTYSTRDTNEDAIYFEGDFSSVEELEAHDR